ncbi:hypothetical protein IAD21_02423 [Abditibacteriota bacterium]|nr:hypothetical protein IAD21_02423 [Abditibacteriota bacterium]
MSSFFNATDLRLELNRRGVDLQIRGTNLVCLPKGAAGELLPEVVRFKPSLIELLQNEQHARELASVILECRRPDAGLDFSLLRPYWYAANELTGLQMDSAQLAAWAKEKISTR